MDKYLLVTLGMIVSATFVGMWAGVTGRQKITNNAVAFILGVGGCFVVTRTLFGW